MTVAHPRQTAAKAAKQAGEAFLAERAAYRAAAWQLLATYMEDPQLRARLEHILDTDTLAAAAANIAWHEGFGLKPSNGDPTAADWTYLGRT